MYFDAHNHLQDPRLACIRADVLAGLQSQGISGAVVNGTREADWPAVGELAEQCERLRPSFGVHPWYAHECSPHWKWELENWLSKFPKAGVGEIGLDRWMPNPDVATQKDVFLAQLGLAAEGNRPATIHCLKAWGATWDLLRTSRLPDRGFLLHAYSGPAEMVQGFVKCGAYFSFSTYFLHERKGAQREVFRHIPRERILVETDAPSMAPPAECRVAVVPPGGEDSAQEANHPFNLIAAYRGLANMLEIPVDELAVEIEENFHRLFD